MAMDKAKQSAWAASGPLRVHPANPRYFADGAGKAVYLAGSHTWANLIEQKIYPEEPDFDWGAYLDFLSAHNHNFIRLWGWEHARWANWDVTGRFFAYPLAFARTGPGLALDGLPKFDLTRFDPAYLERLRTRTESAGERGIYVAVKLFDGFSVGFKGSHEANPKIPSRNPFRGHPFHPANNVNGVDGDADGDGEGKDLHTLRAPAITALQEAYVRKVIDTVNDLDNVLYEICNESEGQDEAVEWQYHMIRFIKNYEAAKPKQHPVGMTVPYPNGRNKAVFDSPADWVSPNSTEIEDYRANPPPGNGTKVIVSDTDHLWGHGGNQAWVWKSFTRGLNLLLMDPWECVKGSVAMPNDYRDHPTWEPIRRSMGYARAYAERMDLAAMTPRAGLSSTMFCLACPGREYLVYQQELAPFSVDLTGHRGPFTVEWFDPNTGGASRGAPVEGGDWRAFTPPCPADMVLYLKGPTGSSA
jgi:hypothetical protein